MIKIKKSTYKRIKAQIQLQTDKKIFTKGISTSIFVIDSNGNVRVYERMFFFYRFLELIQRDSRIEGISQQKERWEKLCGERS